MSSPVRRSPLALTVLALLHNRPLHPYGIQRLIKEWGKEQVVNVEQRASLYRTIDRLNAAGLIAVRQTERGSQYPERTVYEVTGAGREAARTWLREMVAAPKREFPEFPAAVSNMMLLPPERIIGVETGGCPHTAIREDASMNLEAVEEMAGRFDDLHIIFIESGGDNLSATFSPELADLSIFVIDVAEGDKIPRKGGPGITRSDLLIINKTDLAPHVGASLDVMERDARKMRKGHPFVFTNLMSLEGLDSVIGWIKKYALLEEAPEPALWR